MSVLVMGNKNYSSWSIRPWFFIRQAGLPIEDRVVFLDTPDTATQIAAVSPSGRVPALVLDDGEVVYDSLAIGEHLAEAYPEAGVWPKDAAGRRRARSACAEMHSGFGELRRVMTCNRRASFAPEAWRRAAGGAEAERAVEADLGRLHALWRSLLERSGGPFLCGGFGYVDAFFAPVVSRLATYAVESDPVVAAYRARVEALPTYQRWGEEARAESAVIAKYELAIPGA